MFQHMDEIDKEAKKMAEIQAKLEATKDAKEEAAANLILVIYYIAQFGWFFLCLNHTIVSWITMGTLALIVVIMTLVLIIKRMRAPRSVKYKIKSDDTYTTASLQEVKELTTGGMALPLVGLAILAVPALVVSFQQISEKGAHPHSYDTSPVSLAVATVGFLMCCPLLIIRLYVKIKAVSEYTEFARYVKKYNGIIPRP